MTRYLCLLLGLGLLLPVLLLFLLPAPGMEQPLESTDRAAVRVNVSAPGTFARPPSTELDLGK